MSSRLQLQDIERRAWLRTFDHGLWDVGIGLLLASFGAAVLTGYYWLSPIWIAALVPSLKSFARRLIVPRLGHVTFKERRQRSKFRIQVVMGGLVVAGLGMFLLLYWATQSAPPPWVGWIRSHFLIVLAAVWGSSLAVAGWAAAFPRLYLHAALLFGALVLSDLSGAFHLGTALIAAGGAIALVGAALFLRFLRRYPRYPANPEDAANLLPPEGDSRGQG